MTQELDNLLNEADALAPDAVFTNYGKFAWKVNRYIVWADGKPNEVSAAEYGKAPARIKVGEKNLTAKNIELLLTADIQEFKPTLSFTYERKINIGDQDWNATFKPSLEKALNVKIAKGVPAEKEISVAEALARVLGQYVAYKDVPQKKVATDGKTYKTMQIVRVFGSRAACVAAMGEGGNTNGAHPVELPAGYDPKFGEDSRGGDKISAENWIEAIAELVKKGRKNETIAGLFNVPVANVEAARASLS